MKHISLWVAAAALIGHQGNAATPASKKLQIDAQKLAAELRAAGEPKDRCGLGFIVTDKGVVLRNTSGATDIAAGDRIESIDGIRVTNLPVQQIVNILRAKSPTASLSLSVERSGAGRQLTVPCTNARAYNAPLIAALDAAAKGDFKDCLSNLNGREDLGETYWLFRMRCSAANGKLDPATDAQLLYDWLNAAIEDARYVESRRTELLDVLHKSEAGFRAVRRSELHDRLIALSKLWPGSSAAAYASSTPDWAQFRAAAEASVRARLVDPASAQFEWPYGFMYGTWKPVLQKRIEGYFTCGLVNARNRMGGYTGSSSFAVVMADAKTVKWVEISSGKDFDFTDAACAKTAKSLPPAPPQMHLAAPASQPTSIADELEKLAALRDKGIITQAEFDAQKAKLLAK